MRIKRFSIIFLIAVMAVLTKPPFITSQQIEKCGASSQPADVKKPNQTQRELCVCAQNSAKESPTYQISDSAFGIKIAPIKPSDRPRRGVAASRGAIEKTQETALLGSLEIPDSNDLSSPEVANLQKQLLDYREKRRKSTEEEWGRFQKYSLR